MVILHSAIGMVFADPLITLICGVENHGTSIESRVIIRAGLVLWVPANVRFIPKTWNEKRRQHLFSDTVNQTTRCNVIILIFSLRLDRSELYQFCTRQNKITALGLLFMSLTQCRSSDKCWHLFWIDFL